MTIYIPIIYQDKNCVVVNKPAGLLVHRSFLDKHETVFLMQTLRDQLGQHVYPVHRLDKPTSGAILLALNAESARFFTQQFEQKTVEKHYHAIVRGWTEDTQTIDYPLKEQLDDIADEFADPNKSAQSAITSYRTLASSELPFSSHTRFATSRFSLLDITPHTGRKHQIRRHMKHIFHPILGDTTHGDLKQNKALRDFCGNSRLLLHAHTLHFHNTENERIQACAPHDEAWQNVCRALDFNQNF